MSRKNDRGLVVIEQGGGLLWLLVGGAIGAGLGLLLAPHSGRKTRRLLAGRLQTLKDSARDALEDLGEEGKALLEDDEGEEDEELEDEELEEEEEVKRPAGESGGEDDDDAEAPRRRGGSARAELERRLAEARKRRQRVYADEDEEPVA